MTDLQDPMHFLGEAPPSDGADGLFADDLSTFGFVMNASRLWAHQPDLNAQLFALVGAAAHAANLSVRQRGILVTACASTLGDAYCALSWGGKLAGQSSGVFAASVLTGGDEELDAGEQALATWARAVVRDPNGIAAADVSPLRAAGFDDAQILAITLFVGLRLAFSSVNDALGARPDRALVDRLPGEVVEAVTWGRSPLG